MKKNKRIWSWALAGALAMSNLSMVAAPFGGIVAQAAVAGGTCNISVTSENTLRIISSKPEDGNDVTYSYQIFPANPTDVKSGEYSNTISDNAALPVENGYLVVRAQESNNEGNVGDPIYSNVLPIGTAAAPLKSIQKPLKAENGVKNIPAGSGFANVTVSGNGVSGLKLEATALYDGLASNTTYGWVITDDKGTLIDSSTDSQGKFTVTPESGAPSGTKDTDVFTISAGSSVSGGKYTAILYVDTASPGGYTADDEHASYNFNVIEDPGLKILDKNANAIPSTITVDEPVELKLWDKAGIIDDVAWSLDDTTKTNATITSTGILTGKVAGQTAVVEATWAANDDLSLKLRNSAINIAAPDPTAADPYYLTFDDDKLEITPGSGTSSGSVSSAQDMFVGDTAKVGITYKGKNVSVSKWESKNVSVATIDSNGNIDAIAQGSATIVGTYKDDKNENKSVTLTLDVANVPEKEAAYFVGSSQTSKKIVAPGDSFNLVYKNTDGSKIDGTVTWTSDNEDVTVSDKGVVNVSEDASIGYANIYAVVNGEAVDNEFTVQIKEVAPVEDKYTIETDKATLYYGQSATLTVKKNGKAFQDGELVLGGAKQYFTLTGNTIKATTAILSGTQNVTVALKIGEEEIATLSGGITLKADEYVVKSDPTPKNASGVEVPWTLDSTAPSNKKIYTATFDAIEVGQSINITAAYGAEDYTGKMNWTAKDAYGKTTNAVTVSKGQISAKNTARSVVVTGEYTLDNMTYIVEATLAKIVPGTGAVEAAQAAIENADTAVEKAGDAEDKADAAVEAADKAKADPTAENLKAAEAALEDAKSDLEEAKSALKNAQDEYEDAKEAGSVTNEAKAKLAEAKKAVEKAEAKVAGAEEAVEFAQNTFEEIAPEVEKLKLKEAAIDTANTAAATAKATPTAENIAAAKEAIEAAETLEATDEDLTTAKADLAEAEAAKQANDKAAQDKADAIAVAKSAAATAKTTPTAENIAAAKAAIEAAEALEATDEDLETAKADFAAAEAAKQANDKAAKDKADAIAAAKSAATTAKTTPTTENIAAAQDKIAAAEALGATADDLAAAKADLTAA
ncbi:Ig-like domain-containing protein, partial [Butyrivibrio sp. WCE2006]|uniref:Ig-like domain-containing protein n=1 Tax=Butyrivibrio sp. WCE2006 TaxID=1410611 RepID=UPI0018CC0550